MNPKRTIYVAGTPCLGAPEAAKEIERLSKKPCRVDAIYILISCETRKSINGVPVRADPVEKTEKLEEPANPAWTGIPLAARVWRDWANTPQPQDSGYPCNRPSRPRLLNFSPYRKEYRTWV
jgi:hypothetical protein